MTIKAFHIDMNNAQFTGEFLELWLNKLSGLGYNAVIWEVEDNVQWETCPQCSSSQAFSKKEFSRLLDICRSLGLEPIPLLQTIGHCEYVLKHPEYSRLSELPDRVDQYCPMKDGVAELLNKWVDEYLDLFGDVNFFHLGADEAWSLGECPECKKYVEEHSFSELYFQHLNKIIAPLLEKGIRPIIWADMALRHSETINLLDRRVVMCDWMYDIYPGCGTVWNWSDRMMQTPEKFSGEFKERFGKYLFPAGEESSEQANIFYTSDYLSDLGFDVIGCPSSSCFGDSVFLPRIWFRLQNCFGFMKKGYEDKMFGWTLTSWTCHLFPWILQESCIELSQWIENNPNGELKDYLGDYVEKCFGVQDDGTFWKAAEAFASSVFLSNNKCLDIGKNVRQGDIKHIENLLDQIEKDGKLDETLEETVGLIKRFEQGAELLTRFAENVQAGRDVMQWWLVGSANQLNRARVAEYLLRYRTGVKPDNGRKLLSEMLELKEQTRNLYCSIIKSERLDLMMHWIYDFVEFSINKTL